MTRDFQPGDVAMVTWSALGQPITEPRFRIDDERGARWIGADGSWIGDFTAKDARPLAVIDPEDREQVERLEKALEVVAVRGFMPGGVQAALREFANPTPPKPDEPAGVGAVVRSSHSGATYVRVCTDPWAWVMLGGREIQGVRWSDIPTDLTVLSEGVTS
jgi:hypothetical protein